MFSKDEEYIMAEYAVNGVTSIKVYEAQTGEPIHKELEAIFPIDSYQLTFKTFTEEELTFMVEDLMGDGNQEEGIYGLSLEDHSIKKHE